MLKLTTFLTFFFISFLAFSQQKAKEKFRILSEETYKAESKFGEVAKGDLINKNTYKYDSKGNKIEENGYYSDGSVLSKTAYKYEYDSKDNWIKKTNFKIKNEVEKPYEITERVLEY